MQSVHKCEAKGAWGLDQRHDEGVALLGWSVDRWVALQDATVAGVEALQLAWVRQLQGLVPGLSCDEALHALAGMRLEHG
mmetsp:Transcript_18121/g.42053  ORF Transcript_18121/g.42053 Transcript_18121/m.42053 type:complete len:80 (-) Transcript_18121:1730-1969(-)